MQATASQFVSYWSVGANQAVICDKFVFQSLFRKQFQHLPLSLFNFETSSSAELIIQDITTVVIKSPIVGLYTEPNLPHLMRNLRAFFRQMFSHINVELVLRLIQIRFLLEEITLKTSSNKRSSIWLWFVFLCIRYTRSWPVNDFSTSYGGTAVAEGF